MSYHYVLQKTSTSLVCFNHPKQPWYTPQTQLSTLSHKIQRKVLPRCPFTWTGGLLQARSVIHISTMEAVEKIDSNSLSIFQRRPCWHHLLSVGNKRWADQVIPYDDGSSCSALVPFFRLALQVKRVAPKPYRGRRLGSQSLELVFGAASTHKKLKISHIYLHVQVSNGEAKRFYERHGFEEIGWVVLW